MKSILYLCPLEDPKLTLEKQEKMCRKLCKEIYNVEDLIVIKDIEKGKPELRKLWNSKGKFDSIYMFDLSSLGTTIDSVKNKILTRPCYLAFLAFPYDTKEGYLPNDTFSMHISIYFYFEIKKRLKIAEE